MTASITGSPIEPPQPLRHSVRNNLIEGECSYVLEPERLSWAGKAGGGSVPYGAFTRVHLIGYAGSGGRQYQATLKRKDGKPVRIRSHHYVGLGQFEDRGQSYAPFIRELCHRIAAAAPGSRFVSGSTGLWIAWLVVCLLAALLAILAVSLAYLPSAPALPAILVLLVSAPLIWREACKGPATTFDPDSPPFDLLGRE